MTGSAALASILAMRSTELPVSMTSSHSHISSNGLSVVPVGWVKPPPQASQSPPPVALPPATAAGRWSEEEILRHLASEKGAGDPALGAKVCVKATCIKCHRHGSTGEGIGPDLTTVARRFHPKEILHSVLYPSASISSQYAAKSVLTIDGKVHTGIVGAADDKTLVILTPKGEKQLVLKHEVDEMVPHKKSAMPEGLLNELSLQEIADLFSYLGKKKAVATEE